MTLSTQPALSTESYPQKPVRIVIPFAPGGGTGVLACAVSDKFEQALGAAIVIDNRSGAGGTVGCTVVARSAPDGYTWLVTSASYTFAPSLYKDLPYDAVKDFKQGMMAAGGAGLDSSGFEPAPPVRGTSRDTAPETLRGPDSFTGCGKRPP